MIFNFLAKNYIDNLARCILKYTFSIYTILYCLKIDLDYKKPKKCRLFIYFLSKRGNILVIATIIGG